MKTSADSLKKSADALNDSSLWEKKKIKKKDEKTGEEIEVEDYDWDKITKAVKSFVEDYNDVVREAGESNTKDVLRNASWMTGMTDKNSNMLAKIGMYHYLYRLHSPGLQHSIYQLLSAIFCLQKNYIL